MSPIDTCSVQIGEYTSIEAEVKFGQDLKSRVDFVLTRPTQAAEAAQATSRASRSAGASLAAPAAGGALVPCRVYIEVKSVTMSEPHVVQQGIDVALFPDTVGLQLL